LAPSDEAAFSVSLAKGALQRLIATGAAPITARISPNTRAG
jgi:hypothetical protein